MCVPIFKQIASLLAWVERWKVGDFVCKKVGIEWDWELSGELRYSSPTNRGRRPGTCAAAETDSEGHCSLLKSWASTTFFYTKVADDILASVSNLLHSTERPRNDENRRNSP
jgi:hypothetical protein